MRARPTILLLCVGLLVCSAGLFAAGATEDAAVATEEGPVTLKLLVRQFRSPNYDNFSTHYYEKMTNTKLEITAVPATEYNSKLNIVLAGGDRPDIIMPGGVDLEIQYAQAGLLVPLSDYFDKWPNLYERRKDVWNVLRHDDGKVYGINFMGWPVQIINMYREDWLEKLGKSVPETLDQYWDVAYAVSHSDPDGNGKKDTFATGGETRAWVYFDHVFGAYGVFPDRWQEVGGKLVLGGLQEGAKQALKFLNRMYAEALLDPEFVTDNSSRFKTKLLSIYGATCSKIFLFDANNYNNYTVPFREIQPNGRWVKGELLIGPSGKRAIGFRMNSVSGGERTCVVDNRDPVRINAALRLLDWCASEEGTLFQNFGLEGEHYSRDADGVITQTIDSKTIDELGIRQLYLYRTALYTTGTPEFIKTLDWTLERGVPDLTDGIVAPERGKYEQKLRDYADTQLYKMITGQLSIDGGFEDYVANWYKTGGSELEAALNAAYQKRK